MFMLKNFHKKIVLVFIFLNLIISNSFADFIKDVEINGNERISNDTIILFSKIDKKIRVDENILNEIVIRLYETNFFSNVSVKFLNSNLIIYVEENPIIESINYNGVKAKKVLNEITKNLKMKPRSSYNSVQLKKDKDLLINNLQNLGYYFAKVETYVEQLDNNNINLNYKIDLGEKSKIKKISFIGNKVFKSSKLRNIIVSEEYKFWKILSGKKFLNENLTKLDIRLLKNFYLNKGYFNVEVNKSYAKLINNNEFELIFNINANDKIYFNNIKLNLPTDFELNNYREINDLFNKIKGKTYSLDMIEKILNKIESITVSEQNLSVSASVKEEIILNKMNLIFEVKQEQKYLVEKINIYGNNITRENVIRNQLEIDEGDFYNKILENKSVNNIKNLNFFKAVRSQVIDGNDANTKIINIEVDEKATGEISAGAGLGTSGGTFTFGVKENNYLGKGLSIKTNVTIEQDSVKGILSLTDPNFKNSDKLIFGSIQADENDQLSNFGYKSSKKGFSLGTKFEYFDDLFLGLSTSSFFEDIKTDNSASARQKKQAGDYFDSFIKLDFDYDKRNQKFRPTEGYKSVYRVGIPLISKTNTLSNSYEYKYYNEFFKNTVTQFSFLVKTAHSLTGEDIKLSERLFIPSYKLRGFERGKVGPKDGDDYVGGNFVSTLNFSSNLPVILEDSEDLDLTFFVDAANIWGVDYDSSINDNSGIRSSAGISVDWWTPIGPLNFSIAHPITEKSTDITETFRFNIGTSF